MRTIFSLLLSFCFFAAAAQTSLNETLKQQMLKEWERAKVYTQEYLDAMPADKYGFRAVDSIRSFAEQMLHLASANVGLVGIATDDSSLFRAFFNPPIEKSSAVQNKDSVVHYVNTSYDFVINAIKNLDFNKVTEVITHQMERGTRVETRLAWLMKAFEHQTHHRGQCTIYIRLLGIRPPAERLF
jgi:uncharacterized damage-inducible protein DinB